MDAYEYGEVVVVQHSPTVPVDGLAEVLDARAGRRPWRLVDVGAGQPIPSLDGVRGLILLGGRMGVGDRGEYAFLVEELQLVRDAAARAVPTLGICLGSQLAATALGGTVTTRAVPHFGFVPLTRTDDGRHDPVAAGWPDGSNALFLHHDEITALPDGAVELLRGDDVVSAWCSADALTYGVQFHPEASATTVASWCDATPPEEFAQAGADHDALVAEAKTRETFTRATGLSLLGRFVDGVVGKEDPSPPRRAREPKPA